MDKLARRNATHLPKFALLGVIALGAVACPGAPPAEAPKPAAISQKPKPGRDEGPLVLRPSKSGLGFRLSNAEPEHEAPAPVQGSPLTADETRALLARLPAMPASEDQRDFAFRGKSLPAPRPGKTITDAFPPKVPATGGPPTVTSGPLTVTRKMPVGNVDIAPYLSVSFNSPMVAVTSHDEANKSAPPIQLTPTPPGHWRWVGAQTAMFQPDGEFPKSTDYVVEVPAGTRGVLGNTLSQAERFTFSTPTVRMVQHHPNGDSNPLSPVLFLAFDQDVDPQAVVSMMQVSEGSSAVPVRLATEAEIDKDPTVSRFLEQAKHKKRIVTVHATRDFVPGQRITITLPAGLPSAEGPKRTSRAQSYSFSTYRPLAIDDQNCTKSEPCFPGDELSLEFNNALDAEKFASSAIEVSPAITGMKVSVSGASMTIKGQTKGNTRYTVRVLAGLADEFGQGLAQTQSRTFEVRPATPNLFAEERLLNVLDPAAGPKLSVYSINEGPLNVQLYAVTPTDWSAYQQFRQKWDYDGVRLTPPGKLVYRGVVTPKGERDAITETLVDLKAAVPQGVGHVLAIVESQRPVKDRWMKQWVRTWLQVTKLGLTALGEEQRALTWTTDLATGAPLQGVSVFEAFTGGTASNIVGTGTTTDAQGLASVTFRDTPKGASRLLIAQRGNDSSFWYGSLQAHYQRSGRYQFFSLDDRGIYKPSETVRVRGWVREVGYGKGGDVAMASALHNTELQFKLNDPRGQEITKGTATIDDVGGYDFQFKLPDNANLGSARLEVRAGGEAGYHTVNIQEFRRPEFEVSARSEAGPHFVGRHAVATASAKYYSGGGLPNAKTAWRVTRTDGRFAPPNHASYTFGRGDGFDWFADTWARKTRGRDATSETWESTTDASGEHHLRVDFDVLEPYYPMSLQLNATITDVNRQAWSASHQLLVHPANAYVGLKLARAFVQAGQPIDLEVVAADVEGQRLAGRPVQIRSVRLDEVQERGRWIEREVDEATCTLTSSQDPASCKLTTKGGGRYRVTAIVEDDKGRKSQTTLLVWVLAKDDTTPDRRVERGKVDLIADKKEYASGDTAEVLVRAPFAPAEALVTLHRSGIVSTERVTLRSRAQTIQVRLDDAYVPGVTLRVSVVGQEPRKDESGQENPALPKQPAFASGTLALAMPPAGRTLAVAVAAKEQELAPGAEARVSVDLKNPDGTPAANADVALYVVDEAVLALSGYRTPSALAAFYPARSGYAPEHELRSMLLLAKESEALRTKLRSAMAQGDAFGGGGLGLSGIGEGGGGRGEGIGLGSIGTIGHGAGRGTGQGYGAAPKGAPAPSMSRDDRVGGGERKEAAKRMRGGGADAPEPVDNGSPIGVRQDLSALAHWAPHLRADARGHLDASFKLPDSTTRYRVMAVAAKGATYFGSGESTLTARLPLTVRASPPRFLNFGDSFELPVVLQNQTNEPMWVHVAARADNAKVSELGQKVQIAPNDRAEVRLPASAMRPGKARFQVAAGAGKFADASMFDLPVWTPATTEAFATYGTVDQGAIAQPVKMPEGVTKEFGGLEITTSSTALFALGDAVLYLAKYPFDCNEQLASRVLAIASMKDVLRAFNSSELPPPAALAASVDEDLKRLKTRQHWSGGWGFWWGEQWPYLSIHVSHALARAKLKGYAVDGSMWGRALGYLRNVESHIPAYYGVEARRSLIAYSLYVRKLMNDADPTRARRLIAEAGGVEKTPLESLGWLWPTLGADPTAATEVANLKRHLANRSTETAGAAHFVTSYGEGDYLLLNSDRRADGVLLESMIGEDPKNDLIPKLVTGLLGHRKAGRWHNTQENAFVLVAIDKYFRAYENTAPDFVARAWLGADYAGERGYKGYNTERQEIRIPMAQLAQLGGTQTLTLAKEGQGRLYYRVGMQYAPSDLKLPPADHGFTVTREYEPVESPTDVARNAQGEWVVKAGAMVRVRVTMVAPARRHHVALVDPLPAGFEPMNAALKVTGPIPQDPKQNDTANFSRFWARTWYEHDNMRDERVEAFASLLWDGVHQYVYTARATTPGTFVVAPAKAEEMYSPEVFGRSAGDRVIVRAP